MITYQVEDYLNCLPELKQLYPSHYEELSVIKTSFQLEPDYETYKKMAEIGILHLCTVRDAKKLVGYILSIVLPSLHYKSCLTSHEDIYYLLPEYRKGFTGIRLFQFFENKMKELEVDMVALTTKTHLDNSRLFEFLGYSFTEKLYTKLLKDK